MSAVLDQVAEACVTVETGIQAGVDDLCANADKFVSAAKTIAAGAPSSTLEATASQLDSVHKALDAFDARLAELRAKVAKLPASNGDAEVARQTVDAHLKVVSVTAQKLIRQVEQLHSVVVGMNSLDGQWPPQNWCPANPAALLRPDIAGHPAPQQGRADDRIGGQGDQSRHRRGKIGGGADSLKIADLVALFRDILLNVTASAFYAATPAAIKDFLDAQPHLKDLLQADWGEAQGGADASGIIAAATALNNQIVAISQTTTIDGLRDIADRPAVDFTVAQERKFAASLLQACLPQATFLRPLSARAAALAIRIATAFQTVTQTVADAIQGITEHAGFRTRPGFVAGHVGARRTRQPCDGARRRYHASQDFLSTR